MRDGLLEELRTTEGSFGNRPFYYSQLRVDSEYPSRVYSLWSSVSVSDDGGRTWERLGNGVHDRVRIKKRRRVSQDTHRDRKYGGHVSHGKGARKGVNVPRARLIFLRRGELCLGIFEGRASSV